MFLLWIVVGVGIIGLIQLRDRIRTLEQTIADLRHTIDRLSKRLEQSEPPAAVRAPETATPRYEAPLVRREVRASPLPSKPAPALPAMPPMAAPPPAVARPRAEPPIAPPPPRPSSRESAPPGRPFDWETLIGVKFFAIVASLALFLAGGFFVSYSMEHGWLTPPIQFAIGIVAGITCLLIGEWKGSRRYTWTADALDAAGIALLYVVFFAAFARWHLIGTTPAFALFVLTTAVAVLLAIRRASLLIALLGLLGGFASPALVATGQDNPIGLFGYLLLLNAGLAWVAYKKRWPLLTALSLGLTTLYQWAWVSKFLTTSKLPLAAVIFLIFPIVSFVALAVGRPSREEPGRSVLFAQAARVGAILPLLFSIYLAAVPAYGARYGILFGFLFCLDVGLFAVAIFQGPRRLHLLGAASTLIVFAIWLRGSYDGTAWPGVLVAVVVFTLLYLAAPLVPSIAFIRRRFGQIELGEPASRGVLAAPLLLFVFPVLVSIETRTASPALLFGVLLALLAACATFAIMRREGVVHFIAAFFAVVAEAVWSAKYLTSDHLLAAVSIYGVFGLFFIGAPVVARRRNAPLAPQGAGAAIALASIALLFFLAGGAVAQAALPGIALLLGLLTVGLFTEARSARSPLLAIVGTVLAWGVLAVWWMTARVAIALVPALSIVGAYALLTMAGSVWAAHRRPAESDDATGLFRSGAFVGLVGHLFLLFVATQPMLAIPPGPLLAVLGVLTAAAGAGALYMRRGELFAAAIIASTAVIVVWQLTVQVAPWPSIALVAAAALVALACLWLALARRVAADRAQFVVAAAAAALGAQVVGAVAVSQTGAPSLLVLLMAQLAFLAVSLTIVTLDLGRLEALCVVAVVPAAAAGFVFIARHDTPWTAQLLFTTPLYLAFVAYPLIIGRRAGNARAPYLATVLASAMYFFQARSSIIAAGYGSMIGALPVIEAGFLAIVLARLIQLERAGEPRTPAEVARLALIAGAALAFVTVAIPLQLERNWITIGWALEGAVLAWLYSRIPHRGLLLFTVGLCAMVFARLALNPEVLQYEPRGELRIWNWYLYTYLICAAALLVAGRVLVTTDDRLVSGLPRLSSLFPAGAVVLLFYLLNIEIADYFATGPTITFDFFSSTLAQDLSYTLGWAVFAVALLAAGIVVHSKAGRIAAIGLLSFAMGKCAFHDLWRLGGLYRVGSLVGIAFCALLITVALQKFVLASRPEPGEALP